MMAYAYRVDTSTPSKRRSKQPWQAMCTAMQYPNIRDKRTLLISTHLSCRPNAGYKVKQTFSGLYCKSIDELPPVCL